MRSNSPTRLSTTLLALCATAVVGCSDGGTTPNPDTPPTVTIQAPQAGSTYPSGSSIPLSATASDPEDGSLSAQIRWTSSRDGSVGTGASLAAPLSDGAHDLTASVTDSDNRTASAAVAIEILPPTNTLPTLRIDAPGDTTIRVGEVVTFTGRASDVEDGDLTPAIAWTSDLDGALGTGGSTQATLTVGSHVVTAQVTDAAGDAAADSVSVRVDAAPPGAPAGVLAVGGGHACATDVAGRAHCWGDNQSGQHGIGTFDPGSDTPRSVAGGRTFVALTAGTSHTCGLTDTGEAWCWGGAFEGHATNGQLGDGVGRSSATPVRVAGGHRFVDLAAGYLFTCAVDDTGAGWCWGSNFAGELGNGSRTSSQVPVPVSGGHTFVSVSAGRTQACAVDEAGAAWCWGENGRGELGDGTTTSSTVPVPVAGGLTFESIAHGEIHTCGVTTQREAWCWGRNQNGILGNAAAGVVETAPVPVDGGLSFVQLEMGPSHSCGATVDGGGYCWGSNNFGELGDGTEQSARQPVTVSSAGDWSQLLASHLFTCGLDGGSRIHCWGTNTRGQLGDGGGTRPVSARPVAVAGGDAYADLAVGGGSCGLLVSGEARCWGIISIGTFLGGNASPVPTVFAPGTTFRAIAVANLHVCALETTGEARCAGTNTHGQLGDGTVASSRDPVAVTGGHTFMDIAGGYQHTCALDDAGAAWCWGLNSNGALGIQGIASSAVPTAVPGTPAFSEIAAGITYSCGATAGGAVWCWGGIADFSVDPSPLDEAPPLSRLAAGGGHACGLDDSDRAWCWGGNSHGQLGDGTTGLTDDVVQAAPGRAFVQLAATSYGTCGLEASGTVQCWGHNDWGEAGNGGFAPSTTPVPVDSPVSFVALTRSSGTGSHQCGIDASGTVHCWGWNYGGQLGDGSLLKAPVPVPVAF